MTTDATLARNSEDDEPRRSGGSHSSEPLHSPEPVAPQEGVPGRSRAWRYYICILLLFATTINYVDRQSLAGMKSDIEAPHQLNLSNEQYGDLETWFGLAFACGAIFFGFLADRVNVYWLYPLVLALWSMMGFCSGLVHTFAGMLVCRTLLGLFEAGHWPCALRTTTRLLPVGERAFGNSILQSGSSIGAALAPLLIRLLKSDEPGSWRFVFQAIGAIGAVWIVFWLTAIRPRELQRQTTGVGPKSLGGREVQEAPIDCPSFWRIIFSANFLALVLVVLTINAFWHFFRAWLPDILKKVAHYPEDQAGWIITSFYLITDIGCIAAGYLTIRLAKRGMSMYRARLLTFTGCAMLASTSLLVPSLAHGWPLVAALMTVGLGALGMFACFYTFIQDLSPAHQGKLLGILGALAWGTSPLHKVLGRYIDKNVGDPNRFDPAFWFAGACPLIAMAALWLLWTPVRETRQT